LFTRLRRQIGRLGGRELLFAGVRVGVACLPMAAWGVFSQVWWDVLAIPRTAPKVALLCGEMAVAAALFVAAAAALRCDELGWALALLRRRRSKEVSSHASF
jgi:hypothetical protein